MALQIKTIMNKMLYMMIYIILIYTSSAYAADPPQLASEDLTLKSDCLSKPKFDIFDISNTNINISKQKGQWVNTGVSLQKGREFKIDTNINNIGKSVRRYLVLFRIDPRFEKPQVLIQKYNEQTGKYEFAIPPGSMDILDKIMQSNKTRGIAANMIYENIGMIGMMGRQQPSNDNNLFEYINNAGIKQNINRVALYQRFLNLQANFIDVKAGDIITINLYDNNMNNAHEYYFFNGDNIYAKDEWPKRTSGNPYPNIFATRSLNVNSTDHFMNNKIFYTNPKAFNNWIKNRKANDDKSKKKDDASIIDNSAKQDAEKNSNIWVPKSGQSALIGQPLIEEFNHPIERSSITSCQSIHPMKSDPKNLDELCFYNMGEGMVIQLAGSTIKSSRERFLQTKSDQSNGNNNSGLFYYKARSSGVLSFTSDWNIKDMFNFKINSNNGVNISNNDIQLMSRWNNADQLLALQGTSIMDYLTSLDTSYEANFLHFGRYIMYIEIGSGDDVTDVHNDSEFKIEYSISDMNAGQNSLSSNAHSLDKVKFSSNAERNGNLWIRVTPATDMTGEVNLDIAHYTGDVFFSHVIYNDLIKKLIYLFLGSKGDREPGEHMSLTEEIYRGIIAESDFQLYVRALLIIYIIVYGLMFLIGSTRITSSDLVVRILKIGVVMMLFSQQSWDFFSEYLFNLFMFGSSELFRSVIGISSQVCDYNNPDSCNLFGFIDPIFSKYTNGRFWALIGIQLLQFHNGLCFLAIMMIYSILIFFRAVLEVIVNFCVAFVAIAVLVALAPLFITFILFERTRSYFTNWISSLFQFMISPTIMLIFFLMIDQLMSDHLSNVVVEACWDKYIDLHFVLDLHHMGIPLTIPFSLPFLPAIYFYVPQVQNHASTFLILISSSLLFYAYAKMSSGLVQYVTEVVNGLTTIMIGGSGAAAGKIQGDLKSALSVVTTRVKSAGSAVRNKVVGQRYNDNYRARDAYVQDLPSDSADSTSDFGRKVVPTTPLAEGDKKAEQHKQTTEKYEGPIRQRSKAVMPDDRPIRQRAKAVMPDDRPIRQRAKPVMPDDRPIRKRSDATKIIDKEDVSEMKVRPRADATINEQKKVTRPRINVPTIKPQEGEDDKDKKDNSGDD